MATQLELILDLMLLAVGGIVGMSGDSGDYSSHLIIRNAGVNAEIHGNEHVGGILGCDFDALSGYIQIENAYVTGLIEGFWYQTYGLLGKIWSSQFSVSYSYFDFQTTQQSEGWENSTLGSRSTAQMSQQSNYQAWDFGVNGAWRMQPGYTYPRLRVLPQ